MLLIIYIYNIKSIVYLITLFISLNGRLVGLNAPPPRELPPNIYFKLTFGLVYLIITNSR